MPGECDCDKYCSFLFFLCFFVCNVCNVCQCQLCTTTMKLMNERVSFQFHFHFYFQRYECKMSHVQYQQLSVRVDTTLMQSKGLLDNFIFFVMLFGSIFFPGSLVNNRILGQKQHNFHFNLLRKVTAEVKKRLNKNE